MKIKKASAEDLEIVVPLFDQYRQFYEQQPDLLSAVNFITQRMFNDESVIFLAYDEKTNAGMGFVQLYPSFSSVSMKKIWILNDLFVHPDHRRKGVAEELIYKTKSFAAETKAKGVILETHDDNTEAQNLYDKTGFVKDEEHYYYYVEV
ncbi:MAG: GNAT family N-acetyltransferase [Ignavibacteria bacterium]